MIQQQYSREDPGVLRCNVKAHASLFAKAATGRPRETETVLDCDMLCRGSASPQQFVLTIHTPEGMLRTELSDKTARREFSSKGHVKLKKTHVCLFTFLQAHTLCPAHT